ncbi:MAG: non-ribosomal peptide synthetase, partial [Chloroflexota bacterium]
MPIDPSYPRERIRYMLTDSAAPVLLTQSDLESSIPWALEYEDSMRHVITVDRAGVIDAQSTLNPQSRAKPEDLAYVIYTSGSTGQPKGVMVEHHSLAAHIKTVIDKYQITDADGVLQFASVSFDVSLEQIFTALCSGARLVIRGNKLWTLQEFDHQVLTNGITVSNLPPLYCQQLLQRWQTEPLMFLSRDACMEHQLRLLIVGGEKSQPELVTLWQQLESSNMQLLNAYGPTEATITATCFNLSNYQVQSASNNLPIGQPLPNRTVYILDSQLKPTPLGVPGELYIGGVGVARGYLNRPELTAERFIEHPSFCRLYKTGDLCRWLPDGNIEFIGRTDFQVKIRGFRIELGEIESVLLEQESVHKAVVLARENQRGDKQLVAYMVASGRSQVAGDRVHQSANLRRALKEKLPDYMIPVAFVLLDAMPLTPNGKLDRKALPSPDLSHLPTENFTAPRNETEETLAAIWRECLGLTQIGIHDNFFRVGGDSILSIRVVNHALKQGFTFSVRDIFQSPTIAELATVIETVDLS